MARDLENEPSNILYPEKFAEFVKKSSVKAGYQVSVFDEKKISQLNMGAVLAVGKGSHNAQDSLYFSILAAINPKSLLSLLAKALL
jgi:leucyl aminopeptidase